MRRLEAEAISSSVSAWISNTLRSEPVSTYKPSVISRPTLQDVVSLGYKSLDEGSSSPVKFPSWKIHTRQRRCKRNVDGLYVL